MAGRRTDERLPKSIETALKQALSKVAASIEVESAVREVGIEVDRDTLDTAGWAPIVDTIFRKIDDAANFVPDVTFVATRLDGKRQTANPNVLVECGWALKSLKHERILPVMNVHLWFAGRGGDAVYSNSLAPSGHERVSVDLKPERRTVRLGEAAISEVNRPSPAILRIVPSRIRRRTVCGEQRRICASSSTFWLSVSPKRRAW